MKNVTRSTASLNAEEIITNKIYLDGNEISYSILPKLVHRTSLEPEVTVDGVEDKQYYTLHNDAGDCLYVSPSLSEYMYRKTRWWKPWKPGPGGRRNKWQFLPIVLPPHPGGKVKDKTPKTKFPPIEDISWEYAWSSEKIAPSTNKRLWKPSEIKYAISAWEESEIEKFSMQFTKVEDCTRMFYGCKKLRGFYSSNFKKCTNTTGMFEGCIRLKEMTTHHSVFVGSIYASRMFANSGVREVELNLQSLEIANSMFEECPSLQRVKLCMPKCKEMNRIFYNCKKLAEVQFPKDNMQSLVNNLQTVTHAEEAFVNTSISNFTVPRMPQLISGRSMFGNCKSLYQIETIYPKLENGNDMFRGCSDLRYFMMERDAENMGKFPKLTTARFMFRDSVKFDTTDFTDESFPLLEDGMGMFQGIPLTKIPCKFPSLKNARQMFYKTNISGHLELDMPRDFPNVSTNSYSGGDYPTAYMFGSCPITSISFDVSTCDHCVSMFNSCTSLVTCTKAVFKQGGNYQSMFSESRFDVPSARIMIQAANAANVQVLHIGMPSQYRTEEFRQEFGCYQLNEGSDDQWKLENSNVIIKWN